MSGLMVLPLTLCGTALVLNIVAMNLIGALISLAGLTISFIPLMGRSRK